MHVLSVLRYTENDCASLVENVKIPYLVLNLELFHRHAKREGKHCDLLLIFKPERGREWTGLVVELKAWNIKNEKELQSRMGALLEDLFAKITGTLKQLTENLTGQKSFLDILGVNTLRLNVHLVVPESTYVLLGKRQSALTRQALRYSGTLRSIMKGSLSRRVRVDAILAVECNNPVKNGHIHIFSIKR